MNASEIVGVRFTLPDDWHDVDLDSEDVGGWISSLTIAYDDNVDRDGFAGVLASLRQALITDGVDVAAVQLHSPNRGKVGAVMMFELLNRAADDTPEAFLDFARSNGNLRSAELDISALESWSGMHAFGPYVGLTYLALVTDPGATESSLEERAVFTIFPEATTQLVQVTFRTARLGVFDDIAEQASAIVATIELELEPA